MKEIHGFEVSKIAAQYKVCIKGAPKDLRIDIVEDVMGTYMPYCNYYIQSGDDKPYQHNGIHKTIDEALSAILSAFEEQKRSSNIKWISVKDSK